MRRSRQACDSVEEALVERIAERVAGLTDPYEVRAAMDHEVHLALKQLEAAKRQTLDELDEASIPSPARAGAAGLEGPRRARLGGAERCKGRNC